MTLYARTLLYFLFSVPYISYALRNATLGERYGHLFATLQSHFSSHDAVALATLKGYRYSNYSLLLREMPWAATIWTLPTPAFRDYGKTNVNSGIKTNFIALNFGQNKLTYLKTCPTRPVDHYFLDCFFIEERAATGITSNEYFNVWYTRTLSCEFRKLCNGRGGAAPCFLLPPARALSRPTTECDVFSVKDNLALRQRRLRNSLIYLGCAKEGKIVPCQLGLSGFIIKALHIYNVTLKIIYTAQSGSLVNSLNVGNLDIVGNPITLNYPIAPYFDIYQILYENSDIFYIPRGDLHLASFVNIVVAAKQALCLVLATMMCITLVLTIADLGERNGWQFSSLLHFLLLLASLYGTSSPIPRRRSSPVTRTLAYSVWFIAIIPLSSYLRGELVSQLSVRSTAHVMDTLDEIAEALGRKTITPCFRVGTLMHHATVHNRSYTKFHAKLSQAFYAADERTSLETMNVVRCLSCARQKDHVCFTDKLSKCWQEKARGFVESKDTLNPTLTSMLVRKNFALKGAFHKMVRAIRESGFSEKTQSCPRMNGDGPATLQEPTQIDELSSFFVLFVLLLLASSFVLMLEVGIARL
nr:uncharacterized protein LOC129384634 [Dermacentor andersoni]